MRIRTAHSLATLSAVALALWGGPAAAQQVDTNPPLPNVLLLLDNSGSMERMINGNTPETDPNPGTPSGSNACNCVDNGPGVAPTCNWTATPAPNRWGIVQEAFTGSLTKGYGCVAMPRGSGLANTFGTEYSINHIAPYDANYYLPFHRMVAQDPNAANASTLQPAACVVAPGGLNGAQSGQGVGVNGTAISGLATDFTGSCSSGTCSGSIVTQVYGQLTKPVTCAFSQNNDGAITQMRDLMRFGLMTFDQDPDPGVGVNLAMGINTTPFQGMWSYFPGWDTGAACTYSGNPVACSTTSIFAVGARNPAAPPWEGRMVRFPSTNDIATQEATNAEVSEVILATRPYGATPMAGMFVGAQNYLWTDTSGPNGPNPPSGVGDVFAKGGCRPEFIILLTDGAPNLDLQPDCSATSAGGDAGSSPAGKCPFPLPQTAAATLYNNGKQSGSNPSVMTFVIGFAVSNIQDGTVPANCSQFSGTGTLGSLCNCNSTSLPSLHDATYGNIGPCCELQCIAQAGGSTSAYFADTQSDLNKALNAILGKVAGAATTRTTPTYSPVLSSSIANQNSPTTAASVYLAAMEPSVNSPWSGELQREEQQCTYSSGTYNVTPNINAAVGDDFKKNLNSHSGPPRTVITFEPAHFGGTPNADASQTIRPYVANNVGDGLGAYTATTFAGAAASVIPNITNDVLGVPSGNKACPYISSTFGAGTNYLNASQCTTMLLDYTFGVSSFSGPSDFTFVSRYNNALGDIFHANPIVVGPPGSLLQDALYVGFQQTWSTTSTTQTSPWSQSTKGRKTVVYAATNDGLLHAFWADENKLENNEMWAMMPPAVMPHLLSTYPSSHQFLLDGSPIVKDVIWDRNSSTAASSVWHTTLVASYGPYQQGYYAVDVTNPDPTGMGNGVVPPDPPQTGPVFLWQLTKMPATNYQLFGSQSATPAVTTLFMDPGDGQGARDIGVAILPGGQNGGPTSTSSSGSSCARAVKLTDSAPTSGFTARTAVRCWGGSATPKSTDPVVGRSVTIVRVDTGEVIRTFGRIADAQAASNDTLVAAHRFIDTPLDSPMTGTPLVFPTDVGADATKFFVGDADGTLWKFDVSSSNPSNWSGELFADLYNTTVDPNTTTSWADGQPFDVTPILSLDPTGNLVINAATGSIQNFDTTGYQFVYSLSETVQGNPAKLRAKVNWYLGPQGLGGATFGFQPGERVSGPMTVFNGTLYFSTYAAASSSIATCSSGTANLWGRDYVKPESSDLSQGGVPMLQPPPPAAPQSPAPAFITPTIQAGAVIPGISIMGTPACSGLGSAAADQYVAGATHQMPQNFAAGGFSLFTQVGAKATAGGGAATQQFQQSLPAPVSPTSIDSWAGVLE